MGPDRRRARRIATTEALHAAALAVHQNGVNN